jgi:hypothetical protein
LVLKGATALNLLADVPPRLAVDEFVSLDVRRRPYRFCGYFARRTSSPVSGWWLGRATTDSDI